MSFGFFEHGAYTIFIYALRGPGLCSSFSDLSNLVPTMYFEHDIHLGLLPLEIKIFP